MNRRAHLFLSCLLAIAVALTPTAAGAADANVAVAANEIDGAAVVEASVQYRVDADGRVDPINRAVAAAKCTGCQTLAAAFQLVLITADYDMFVPRNSAYVNNVECVECVTWASAKQVLVETGGPAHLSGSGQQRLQAIEDRLEALEADLPRMTLEALQAALNAEVEELVAIAVEEVVRTDGGPDNAAVVAVQSS